MQVMTIVTLIAVGLAAAFAVLALRSRRSAEVEDRVMKGYFLLGLSGLMAKIAMADGKVTVDEADMASKFFKKMDLTAAERAMCIGNFITSRREGLDARDHAKRFMAYGNAAACEFLYSLLWRISSADGVLDPAEDKMLFDIAKYLGLDEDAYERYKSGKKCEFDRNDLLASGVPKSLASLV